jgi:hypothetical protein
VIANDRRIESQTLNSPASSAPEPAKP